MRITRLDAAPRCKGGENPMWDEVKGLLYYIDNVEQKVQAFDPQSGQSRTLDMPSVITTLVLRADGGAVVTLRTGIQFLDLDNGELKMIAPLPDNPRNVYNDGKVDSRGRFLIGSSTRMNDPRPDGGLFRLDPDLSLIRLDEDIYFSNGPCWSPDERLFFFSDSWRRTIYAYDYEIATGGVSNRRRFVSTETLGGLPDGATVDAEGRLWVALYEGSAIVAFRSDGMLDRRIEMPVLRPSSVVFGGPNLDRLFVTTIDHGTRENGADAHAGCLFVIDGLGVRGRAENRFGVSSRGVLQH